MEKVKVIISDCHLSAGKFCEGRLNPFEDFHYDEEMIEFFRYFSTGKYGSSGGEAKEVELIINGDFLDFLNIPIQGEFSDAITEDMALFKLESILKGHQKVMDAIRHFASQRGKTVTYMIGNHDAELFFPKVRERIIREWDPEGRFPSEKVRILSDIDRISIEGGIEVHHGNQMEAVHVLNFQQPLLKAHLDQPVLNLPWGSFYVLKVLNHFKAEREYIDKIRPIKVFILYGLIFDTWFTLKFCFLSVFYFLKTRFVYSPKRRSRFRVTMNILKQETQLFMDLEKQARDILNNSPHLKTVIFGHTHYPMNKVYPDGKQYINTGTWTRMINLDLRRLGQHLEFTFALITIKDGQSTAELRQWMGEHHEHRVFGG